MFIIRERKNKTEISVIRYKLLINSSILNFIFKTDLYFYLASEVTLMNIRNARKVFEKLEKEGVHN